MIRNMNLKTMPLSNEQIQELIKNPRNQEKIKKGIKHELRLKFHTETCLSKWEFSEAYLDWTQWIGSTEPELLPKDKVTRIQQLIRPPIQTTELTESIFSRLYRVFISSDSFFEYLFTNPELTDDWDTFHDYSFWKTFGFQAMQSAIDSVWIVDLPEKQKGERPEPVDRLINISDVIDIENDQYNNCKYVIFRQNGKIFVYDESAFTIYNIKEGSNGEPENTPLNIISHPLGYCPARMFWSESIEDRNFINKESPITKVLSDLDWLLLHKTSKKYMDLANSYPIEVVYREHEDFLSDRQTENKDRPDNQKIPKGQKGMGPGTVQEVDAPRSREDPDLMNNPIKLISPDVETLEWHVKEEKRLTEKIFKSVVGSDQEVKNDQAKNELQIESSFESQEAVLLRIKRNFEIIQKFADSTKAKLRYGNSFLGCQIDYGRNFFLYTLYDLIEDYEKARKANVDPVILDFMTESILDTKFRNDPKSRTRARIIRDLDPMPEKTVEEILKIKEKGGISDIDFRIKMNLESFIRRFEREQVNLTEFAKDIDYFKKIQLIKDELKNYANES